MSQSDHNQDRLRLLVVDDDDSIRTLMMSMLQDSYSLASAESAAQGLELMTTFCPNIVVTDVQMPEVNGFSFMQQAKAIDPSVLFIMVTGYSNKAMAISAIREGAYDFVEKPFSSETLGSAVRRAADGIISARNLHDARERSIQSEKLAAVGLMAGSIIHELMNPIAIIEGVARRMLKKSGEDQVSSTDIQENCNKIISLVDRVVKINNSMRNMVRQTAESSEATKIRAIIEDATNLVSHIAKQKSISIAIGQFSPEIEVVCRRVEISQIVLNLLNNAVHALEGLEDRRINIDVGEQGDNLIISVTDSGPGIPVDIREKIFGMFYTTKPVGKGTGLGLSTSRQIAINHGGTLDLDPGSPNTRFMLTLPKTPPQAKATDSSE
jgi:signal transduction histidine kinase